MAYFFRLPPYNKLTPRQQVAVDCADSVKILGGPGTGKSVVTLWRHILQTDLKKNTVLLTYSVPLRKFLEISAVGQKGAQSVAARNILTTKYFLEADLNFSELILDETQDLSLVEYNGITNLKMSYAIDPDQSTNLPKGVLEELVTGLNIKYPNNTEFLLDKNYRNTKEILSFVKALFPHKLFPREINSSGPIPKLLCTNNSRARQEAAAIDIINLQYSGDTHNIAILVQTAGEVDNWFEFLSNQESWNVSRYRNSLPMNGIENVHVTTFKSVKGLEFDTVIIPDINFLKFDVEKPNKFTNENEFYVALTRCKTNLFLIDNSEMSANTCILPSLRIAIEANKIKPNYEYK